MYELRHPDHRPDLHLEGDAASVSLKATRLFLRRHGPATVDEIADWAALTKGPVRDALTALRAKRITVDGWSDEAWLLPDEVGIWEYDPEAQRVVRRVWDAEGRLHERVAHAANETERFIRQRLGDPPLSAVDPPARRAIRMTFCRKLPKHAGAP